MILENGKKLMVFMVMFQPAVLELQKFISENNAIFYPISSNDLFEKIHDPWAEKHVVFATGDKPGNICKFNSKINEWASIYYITKNYEALGNPDYVGICSYRRFFAVPDILDVVNYDYIVRKPIIGPNNLDWQYRFYHRSKDLDFLYFMLNNLNPNLCNAFKQYMFSERGLFANNLIVTTKRNFFNILPPLCNIAIQLAEKIDISALDNYQSRVAAFLTERMFSFFINNEVRSGKHIKLVEPIFKEEFKTDHGSDRAN